MLKEPVAQQERSEGKTPRLHRLSLSEPCELEAATADVEDETGTDREAVHGSQERVPRLILTRNDADVHAGLATNAFEQRSRIG